MTKRTCAACDCELDANPIKVRIGGKTVEVCCDDCAKKLKEAHAATKREMLAGLFGSGVSGLAFSWLKNLG